MRAALRTYPARLGKINGKPAAHIRDPHNEIEYRVQVTDEPDSSGRYQITQLVATPDPGVRMPDGLPARTLAEIAAEVLGRKEPAARGGNRYKGPDPSELRALVEEGLNRQELSQRLGRSVYTVDSWLKRARRLDPTFPTALTKTGKRATPSKRQRRDLEAMGREGAAARVRASESMH